MKKIISILSIIVGCASLAKTQSVKITVCAEHKYQNKAGEWQMGKGQPASHITVPQGKTAMVYFQFDIGKGKLASGAFPAKFIVTSQSPGAEEVTHINNYMIVPAAPQQLNDHMALPAGNYTAKVVNRENLTEVWASSSFTITETEDMVTGGRGTMTVCKYIDDNYKPVDVFSKIAQGTCVNFLVNIPQEIPALDHVGWMVFRVGAGDEEKWVNEYQMTLQKNHVSRFCTTSGICAFNEPGRYVIYAIHWPDRQELEKKGHYQKYFAKTFLTVE